MRVATSEPTSVWNLGASLGEGPIWVERDQALWFVDIVPRKIHRFQPESGGRSSWEAPSQVGFILPSERGGFVVGLKEGLARFDEGDGSFRHICNPAPDRPGNGLNDAGVDCHGRLWFGSVDAGGERIASAICRLGDDGDCLVAAPLDTIINGPAASPDGRTLYHVDTIGGVIHAWDVDDAGILANRRELIRVPFAAGYPDGVAVDSEGCLWVGLYAGWGVRRYSPKGELLEEVRFPVDAVTKIAFGGPDLRTVYATTASKHLSDAMKAERPQSGDLFSFRVSVPGQAGLLVREGV